MASMTDEELAEAQRAVSDELARRQSAEALERELNAVLVGARESGVASTPEQGAEWRRPLSVVDAYALGDTVTHDGKTWASTITPNTWEPGVAGWRAQDSADGTPAEWVRPSSTIDAYQKGDRVTFQGAVWESVFDGPNTWSPTDYPDAWKKIG
ncbi:hypothetical protein Bra3105_06825 [Brachybacterium halotolerans subsp. kimchii]|uniref:hypothetical protein n=1 Tax=Brachybacterium halotolerans TaxID=2795215 RepID=UPI001E41310A|nr:hypothetical protein [Brachybacterium halotolerans]UEJ84020.1 hypothetical protein Bra3105_06825 [Brachybacterium halotolerans subsp. kimchii]